MLEYASIIWSPYYDKYVNKLESVQRRMARFVCNEYGSISVTNLLKNLSWPTLQQRRICNRGIMLYLILKALPPVCMKYTARGESRVANIA